MGALESHPDVESILFDAAALAAKTEELGARISADYRERTPLLLLGILKGSFMFMADLARAIELPLEVDFMAVSSYGDAAESSGVVKIVKDLDRSIRGVHVLVVEDIVDSGRTLAYLLDNLRTRDPASVSVCTLLDKKEKRVTGVPVDYTGFHCPDSFVVGYGLDYAGEYRNLPFVGVLKPSVVAED